MNGRPRREPVDRAGRKRRHRPRASSGYTNSTECSGSALASQQDIDEIAATRAYIKLGKHLGLDWAQQQVTGYVPSDHWKRLLTAGLARDFEQLRIEFLSRLRGKDPEASVERWIEQQQQRIDQFRKLVARARAEGHVSASMLAQIAARPESSSHDDPFSGAGSGTGLREPWDWRMT